MKSLGLIMSIFVAQGAVAQDNKQAANVSLTTNQSSSASVFSDYKLLAGIKSTNNSGRVHEMNDKHGRRFKTKAEYYIGAVHTSGWGLQALAVTSGTDYATPSDARGREQVSGYGAGDPSLTVLHPTLYDDGTMKVSGQFRRYFPVSNRSVNRNQRQYAYYNYINYKLGGGWSVFNQLIPRYFDQDRYEIGDTDYYIEDLTVLSQAVNSWLKYGVSQWSQVEWHRGTATGTAVELIPFMNFAVNSKFYIEPRLRLPIQKVNAVYDSARMVSLDNAQAEVYAQLTL